MIWAVSDISIKNLVMLSFNNMSGPISEITPTRHQPSIHAIFKLPICHNTLVCLFQTFHVHVIVVQYPSNLQNNNLSKKF